MNSLRNVSHSLATTDLVVGTIKCLCDWSCICVFIHFVLNCTNFCSFILVTVKTKQLCLNIVLCLHCKNRIICCVAGIIMLLMLLNIYQLLLLQCYYCVLSSSIARHHWIMLIQELHCQQCTVNLMTTGLIYNFLKLILSFFVNCSPVLYCNICCCVNRYSFCV